MTYPDAIARRQLEKDGRNFEVVIHRPRASEDESDTFFCTWSLVDDHGAVVTDVTLGGMDGPEALIHVLSTIGEYLAKDGFTWHGIPGTGFPRHVDPHNRPGVVNLNADTEAYLANSLTQSH